MVGRFGIGVNWDRENNAGYYSLHTPPGLLGEGKRRPPAPPLMGGVRRRYHLHPAQRIEIQRVLRVQANGNCRRSRSQLNPVRESIKDSFGARIGRIRFSEQGSV